MERKSFFPRIIVDQDNKHYIRHTRYDGFSVVLTHGSFFILVQTVESHSILGIPVCAPKGEGILRVKFVAHANSRL